jgi:flagellar motor protein MotB
MSLPARRGQSGPLAARAATSAPLLLALGALASGTACVSKSTYLKKIDDAVKFRTEAESCARSLRIAGEVRQDLEDQIKGLQNKVAGLALDGKRCRAELERVQPQAASLRDDLRKSNDEVNELRAKVAVAEEQARGLRERIRQMLADAKRAREPDLSDVEAALKAEVEAGAGVTMEKRKGAMVLRIPQAALFRRRTPVLTRTGRELAIRLADAFGRLTQRTFLLEGHQDDTRVPRRWRSPTELSLAQAVALGTALIQAGLDPSRMAATGLGAARPLASGDDPDAREKNRRVEIVVRPASPAEALEVIGPARPPAR